MQEELRLGAGLTACREWRPWPLLRAWGLVGSALQPVRDLIARCPRRRKSNQHLRGSTSAAAAQRRLRRMKASGSSPRDPRRPIRRKARRTQVESLLGGGDAGGAEASLNGSPPHFRLNLRRTIRFGAWNVNSLSDIRKFPAMSRELRRFGVAVAEYPKCVSRGLVPML